MTVGQRRLIVPFAIAALFPLVAAPLVPVREERELS